MDKRMLRRVLLIAGSLAVLAGSLLVAIGMTVGNPWASHHPSPAVRDVWASLRRPLMLASLPPGAPCPVSGYRMMTAIDPSFQAGDSPQSYQAFGPGPIYPIPYDFEVGNGVRYKAYAPPVGGWYPDKVLWRAAPTYQGSILIRGKQLDGPNAIRFFTGYTNRLTTPDPGQTELEFAASSDTGWRDEPSGMLLSAAGCYGFQIDTGTGSQVVVFRAID